MIKKVFKEGKEARESVIKGAIWACDKGINTIGPAGRNALLGRAYMYGELTNDCKTIMADLYLDDEIEQLGVDKIKETTVLTFDKGGDNTTTTVALIKGFLLKGQEMLNTENPFIKDTLDPIKVRNEIQKASDEICKLLDKEAKPVKTFDDMKKVAFASTENEQHAEIIANMFNIIGKDGDITIEDGYDDVIESEIVEGFEIEAGFHSDIMANKEDKTYVKDNPVILITDIPINFHTQVINLTHDLFVNHKVQDLIIIADSFSKETLHKFSEAKLSNNFNIVAIKAPYFNKKHLMEDTAIALGATFIDKEKYTSFDNVKVSDLGSTKKVIVNKDKATFLKPKGDTKERIKEINKDLKINKQKYDQEQLKKRLAKLSGGVGLIKVGSVTTTNRDYLKKKILNGKNSVKSALKEGAIKGGGLTLIEISDKIPSNILAQAIRLPYEAIQKNAGGNLKIGDNILDASYNIKTCIQVASKMAGDLLTIEFANADKYEKPKDFTNEE